MDSWQISFNIDTHVAHLLWQVAVPNWNGCILIFINNFLAFPFALTAGLCAGRSLYHLTFIPFKSTMPSAVLVLINVMLH